MAEEPWGFQPTDLQDIFPRNPFCLGRLLPADNTRIFDFIETVQGNAVNNALVPFRDFTDMESYLRQQWAGMMFSFLLGQNENARVTDTLAMLKSVSDRVEMLSRQILQSVGTKSSKITALLYDKVLQHACARDMAYMGARPTPELVLANDTFDNCFAAAGGELDVKDESGSMVGQHGTISRERLNFNRGDYTSLRRDLVSILSEHDYTVETYLADMKRTEV